MKTKSFTLTELLVAISIIGILAAIALPSYTRFMEKAKADQAITYLKVIRTGEKVYYANNSIYIVCADASAIKSQLSAEVTTENYTFNVAGNPDIADSFIVTATRVVGGKTITLDQDNNWGGTSEFKP